MTDRLTPAMLRDLADIFKRHRETCVTSYGAVRQSLAGFLRDEAARREAEQEGSLECPTCGGSGHIDDFKARREAKRRVKNQDEIDSLLEDGTACRAAKDGECHWNGCPQMRDNEPANSGRHCPLDTPEAARREAEGFKPNTGCKTHDACRKAAFCMDAWHCAAKADAPPPPAPFVTDHKWLDPECHASGCQTLILKAELEKLRERLDKYMWQVRDTCARAEAAEAREKRLRELASAMLAKTSVVLDRPKPPIGEPCVLVEYDAARSLWDALAQGESK